MYNVSAHRFLSPAQGFASHDDEGVFEDDAVAPVCCKNVSLLRELRENTPSHLISWREAGAAPHGHVACGASALEIVFFWRKFSAGVKKRCGHFHFVSFRFFVVKAFKYDSAFHL